jgi:hypothetical protein
VFDPADKATWPVWMRVRHICTRPGYSGPFPGAASTWWERVRVGRIPRPVKFSPKISAWHRDTVAEVTKVPKA